MPLPLSVLDLSPVPAGSTGPDALANTLDLASWCERLGYSRYWLAEHHSTPGLASSAPEVMIGQVAATTSRIRVGSGGIMLPNHAPLRVAETFRVLEALYPDRIDLGIGRAPGADRVTAFALRRSASGGLGGESFGAQLGELLAYGGEGFPHDHPFRSVRALPDEVPLPPIWILGSTEESAQIAAALGVGYAFARFLGPRRAEAAMAAYRDGFQPSAELRSPRSMLAAAVVCADDAERAEQLAASMGLGVVRMRQGRPGPLPTPEQALAHDYTPDEQDQLRRYRRAQVVGDPPAVRAELDALCAATRADELIVMTAVHDHGERRRSYELLAGAYDLDVRTAERLEAGWP